MNHHTDTYNVNDMDITIAQQPDTMIARKNVKLVDSLILVEHGTLVTVAIAVNASGNMILPTFIFPRNYREYFEASCPPGCIDLANQYN